MTVSVKPPGMARFKIFVTLCRIGREPADGSDFFQSCPGEIVPEITEIGFREDVLALVAYESGCAEPQVVLHATSISVALFDAIEGADSFYI